MTCRPNLRNSMPARARSGLRLDQADDIAGRGIAVHAQQQVGRGEIEEAESVRLHELGTMNEFAQQLCAAGGICTAMMASQAFDEAS